MDMNRPTLPWWRVPVAWLVVGGPALVVVACIATAVVAVRGADVPLREVVRSQGRSHDSSHGQAQAQTPAQTPATQARNHAAAPRR